MANMTRTARVAVVALSAVAAMASGGCGGSSGGSAPEQPATTASTPGASSTPTSALPKGVLSSVAMNTGPIYITAAFGSIWAPSHRDNYVDRVDPQTGRIIARIDVGQDSCSPTYPTPTKLLVSPCDDGTRSPIIDPKTNQVVGSIPGFVFDYAYGAGWFSNASGNVLQRVDIATRQRVKVARIWVGTVVHGHGKVWVAESSPDEGAWLGGIAEVDPHTNRVIRTVKISDDVGLYANLVYAFGALWLQGGGKAHFYRIDPVTGAVKRFDIPAYEANTDLEGGDIAAGDGSLWMQTSPSTIGRFDPRTGKLTGRFPADGTAGGSWPLAAYGSLWVTNFDTSTLWRDRLTS